MDTFFCEYIISIKGEFAQCGNTPEKGSLYCAVHKSALAQLKQEVPKYFERLEQEKILLDAPLKSLVLELRPAMGSIPASIDLVDYRADPRKVVATLSTSGFVEVQSKDMQGMSVVLFDRIYSELVKAWEAKRAQE